MRSTRSPGRVYQGLARDPESREAATKILGTVLRMVQRSDLRIATGGARNMRPEQILQHDNRALRERLRVATEVMAAMEHRPKRAELALAALVDRADEHTVEIEHAELERVLEERELQLVNGPRRGDGEMSAVIRPVPAGTADRLEGTIADGGDDA